MKRTHKEFMKQVEDAHDCEKCHGKIVGIMADYFGNTYCAYCGRLVNYPKVTKEEIEEWFEDITFKNVSKVM